jgi:hypothetical protein
MDRSLNLLDLALGFDEQLAIPSPLNGKVILIEDCVETSGSFVLHQLMKRVLSSNSSDALIFLAFARPFSHYDRILRKLVKVSIFFTVLSPWLSTRVDSQCLTVLQGCNLATHKSNNRLVFFDMLMVKCSGETYQVKQSI